MSRSAESIRYGQVWVSRDDVMGPMNYLVVSSDAYNAAFGDRRVIAVEVGSRSVYEGTYREPIVDAGTALLDRLVWVARGALEEQVAELHPERHASVATQIRELIGNRRSRYSQGPAPRQRWVDPKRYSNPIAANDDVVAIFQARRPRPR